MRKLLGILLLVVTITSCNDFQGCGIVKEKYITSDGGGYLVIELEDGKRVVVNGIGVSRMDRDIWANAKIGGKYCQ
jgi:hypothetical protein